MKFEDFNLDDQLLEALHYSGFEEATEIQEKAIPQILDGKDVIACAQTGTGKTAAFLLPTLHRLAHNTSSAIKALVIVPTRELAIQIDQQVQGFSYFVSVSSLPVYGGGDGADWSTQRKALEAGVDIIVATPGKLISHIQLGHIDFSNLEYLILDEADRMLDMGFKEDIELIISKLPKKRQNLLFSATMPEKIRAFAKKILVNPFEISIAISKPAEGVLQAAYLTYDTQKTQLIVELIQGKEEYERIIIFCSTRKKVTEITRALKHAKLIVESISSDLEQKEREEVLLRFKSKKTRILVATDVISRGIDIKDINLVINYDVPSDAEDYVHRIGRTARANTTGVALTFINQHEMLQFHNIEKLIEKTVMKIPLPEGLGDGPEWKLPERKGKSGKKFHKKKRNYNPKHRKK